MFYSNGAYSLFKVDTPVISGGATPPSFQDIYSYEFDGVDDYIDCGTNTNLRFNRLDPFTFSAWVKIDSTKTHTVFSNQDAPSVDYRGYFFAVNPSNQIIVILRANLSDRFIFTSTTSIITGTWNHIVFTYDGSATQSGGEIYINGSIDTITRVGSLVLGMASANPLYIGSRDYSDNFFDGNIDEVAIFNTELSASDVTTIYNSGIPNNLNDLSTPPLSWWRMGESANWDGSNWTLTDQGSGGNNATSQNMIEASRVTDVPPNPFTNTLSTTFDGIDDYVDMGNNLNFERTSAFSISAWIKRGNTGVNDTVVSKMESSGNFRGYLVYISSTNVVKFVLRNVNISSNRLFIDSTSTITDTYWHHILVTYDGSSSVSGVKIYIDGVSDTVTTAGTLSATTLNSSPFNIGARNSNSLFATATIDEVAIFNSELSQSDVTTIYNSGVPNDISSLSPLSWWRCGDNDTAPILNDNGSGSNDGTMTNFSTFSTDVPT